MEYKMSETFKMAENTEFFTDPISEEIDVKFLSFQGQSNKLFVPSVFLNQLNDLIDRIKDATIDNEIKNQYLTLSYDGTAPKLFLNGTKNWSEEKITQFKNAKKELSIEEQDSITLHKLMKKYPSEVAKFITSSLSK